MFIKNKITDLFKELNELSVKELTDRLGASKQMVHLVLNKLLEEGKVEKLGRTPKTVYRFVEKLSKVSDPKETYSTKGEKDQLEKNFIVVTETGNLLKGMNAFEHWCKQRNLPPEKTLNEFIETRKKYSNYYDKSGIIDGTAKLKGTKGFREIYLDKLFYLDFYAIERFGKTRLGTLLHYAKQGQNKFLMRMMMDEINKRIKDMVKKHKADAIAFVPPTIKREVQIMKFIQSNLSLSLPIIEVKKISGIIPVPQKSLSKIEERIKNAEDTFAVTDQRKFKHVIMIDDAVGSGATMNQIAGKILKKETAKKVTGLAVVGSFKGFDVVSDV